MWHTFLMCLAGPLFATSSSVISVIPTHATAAVVYIVLGLSLAAASRPASRSKTFYVVFSTALLTCVLAVLVVYWMFRNRAYAGRVGMAAAVAAAVGGVSIATQLATILAYYTPALGVATGVLSSLTTVVWVGMPVAPRRLNILRALIVATGAAVTSAGVFILLLSRAPPRDTSPSDVSGNAWIFQNAVVIGVTAAVGMAAATPPLVSWLWNVL